MFHDGCRERDAELQLWRRYASKRCPTRRAEPAPLLEFGQRAVVGARREAFGGVRNAAPPLSTSSICCAYSSQSVATCRYPPGFSRDASSVTNGGWIRRRL